MTALTSIADIEHYLFRELPPMQASVMTGHGAGVRRVSALLTALGDAQEDLRVVHVAGTAGKGSVCAFVTAVLEAHGYVVGRYLSPHAHTVLERFAVHGRPVEVGVLAPVLSDVRTAERAARTGPDGPASMFEVATVTAFQLFRSQGVDYAVMETGLGGRHDATNVVRRPDKLAVLTSIGIDHVDVLGASIDLIAAQKAGILPVAGRAVAVSSGPEADAVLGAEAQLRNCRLELSEPAALAASLPAGACLALPGRHQRVNAALALMALAILARRDGWRLQADRVAHGLSTAVLPGRFERRRFAGHPLVLDGAHNPMKLAALIDAVARELGGRPAVWVLGVKPDKDLAEILRLISPVAALVIATEFDEEDGVRAVSADDIAATAQCSGLPLVEAWPRATDALRRAVEASRGETPVVVTGSFHIVAAAGRRSAEGWAPGTAQRSD